METVKLTSNNFHDTVIKGGTVVIDCWAEWCGSCRAFDPVFREVAARHPEHVFGRIATHDEPELTKSLGVEHVPTLLVYRDGLLLFQKAGNFDEKALEDIVSQATLLDIEAVRAEMARTQSDSTNAHERTAR
jgi:thioredoxin 1